MQFYITFNTNNYKIVIFFKKTNYIYAFFIKNACIYTCICYIIYISKNKEKRL
ncbi:hypothetical protein [Brachyspira suanatina]|uniref:hypothetical protein n=1 Tax=Brachyspira suanatina TaxID=381802 RepID=UPI003CC9183B